MSVRTEKKLPQVNSDFYAIGTTLSEEDQDFAGGPGLPGGRGCPRYHGVLDS